MLSLPRFTRNILDSFDDDFMIYPMDYLMPRTWHRNPIPTKAELSVPTIKDNKYQLALDLRNFDPSEISVKMNENTLEVFAKREKKSEDGHSFEMRQYHHHFTVPENVQSDQMKCRLDERGYLRIEAPVKGQIEDKKERNIPIEFVNKPAVQN